jgi:hypothetical protein
VIYKFKLELVSSAHQVDLAVFDFLYDVVRRVAVTLELRVAGVVHLEQD